MIDQLWGQQAVGILGGQPKSYKSWCGLDMAVSVAAGVPCLRQFEVKTPGPVIFFPAEDGGPTARDRIEGIARAAGTSFKDLEIEIITAPTLRLDLQPHCDLLDNTVRHFQPRLLVLDPLVRLHRVDENAASEITPLLSFLRDLQRKYNCAALLVHHARKSQASRPGQALRGSSDLHAWGDSNLYLRRKGEKIILNVEHRAAPSPGELTLELNSDLTGTSLRMCQTPSRPTAKPTPEQRVLNVLKTARTPLSQSQIRKKAAMPNATVGSILASLLDRKLVCRDSKGAYRSGSQSL